MAQGPVRLVALALLALAGPAAGETIVGFDAFAIPKGESFFAAQGWHLAALSSTETEDLWTVNGLVRARGPRGTLPGGGVISADGSALLHVVEVAGGQRAAVNGTPYGAVYSEIKTLAVSPRGGNAAFTAETPRGWAVVSAQGTGPAFPAEPERLVAAENGTFYVAAWQGRSWLYRDHKPVQALPEGQVFFSPDFTRWGRVVRRDVVGTSVEFEGLKLGPYSNISAVVFSPNGRHWAFQPANTGPNRRAPAVVVVDGRPTPAKRCGCALVVDDAGRVFQDEILVPIPKGEIHAFYHEGKELYRAGRPPHVATSPNGTDYVYPMMTPMGGSIGMNKGLLRKHAPIPIPWGPLVFDGPSEFHYWAVIGDRLHLICATTDGTDVMTSRCAARGAANGWALVP